MLFTNEVSKDVLMRKSYFAPFMAIIWLIVIYKITASPSATGSNTMSIIQSSLGLSESASDFLNFIIRKLAHIIVFGFLAILLYFIFKKNRFFWAWLCTTLYAGTDEFHQLLVSGRTSSFDDVMLDSFSAAVALLLLISTMTRWKQISNNRPHRKTA
ncbi:VanZ family protein [Rummeliibacillus pycnus]|uniref:VanZ family protein n=1 Tax=Rummeliibacillus pycnus TaxID=101070 RepID=UPI000C9CD846|nr:VanZ family protein [Rummeliibacillus pycnus]